MNYIQRKTLPVSHVCFSAANTSNKLQATHFLNVVVGRELQPLPQQSDVMGNNLKQISGPGKINA